VGRVLPCGWATFSSDPSYSSRGHYCWNVDLVCDSCWAIFHQIRVVPVVDTIAGAWACSWSLLFGSPCMMAVFPSNTKTVRFPLMCAAWEVDPW
jgi:hypothetical protein